MLGCKVHVWKDATTILHLKGGRMAVPMITIGMGGG
jgi:hypothetical protein